MPTKSAKELEIQLQKLKKQSKDLVERNKIKTKEVAELNNEINNIKLYSLGQNDYFEEVKAALQHLEQKHEDLQKQKLFNQEKLEERIIKKERLECQIQDVQEKRKTVKLQRIELEQYASSQVERLQTTLDMIDLVIGQIGLLNHQITQRRENVESASKALIQQKRIQLENQRAAVGATALAASRTELERSQIGAVSFQDVVPYE